MISVRSAGRLGQALAASVLALIFLPLTPAATGGAAPARPNIVLIVTDDQRWDSMGGMATVQSELIGKGVTFTNGFVVNSLCCPSRASILTGQYSHSTGVWTNRPPHGGFQSFDDSSTIATWLQDGGYTTAHIGRYLNGYDGTQISPGWDRWVTHVHPARFYDYQLNVDGSIVSFGSSEADYSTDVLAAEAVSFIESVDPADPLFLMFESFAPHGPAIPAPRHEGTFPVLSPWRPPSYNGWDVRHKPGWVRKLDPWTGKAQQDLDEFRRKQYQSLLAVDEAVADILKALKESGRLQDTMIVYISDNGYMWGEHRWAGKLAPYNESIRIPFIVRYDPVTSRRTNGRLVLNIDLAPTFAQVAGVAAPGAEGKSLLPLLAAARTSWRSAFAVERFGPRSRVPTYCAVRKLNRLYVRYQSGFEEYYNLRRDPWELVNRAKRPGAAKVVARFRQKAERFCQPAPPGYSF